MFGPLKMYSSVILFLSVILLVSLMRDAEGVMCRQEEREALLDFKKAAEEGYEFIGLLEKRAINKVWFKWDEQEEECCAWQGVTCDLESGRVNKVQLPVQCESPQFALFNGGCDRSYWCSTLPSSLSRLEALEVLDLRNGCFSGAIFPLTFSTLTNLSYLDLSGNPFQSLPYLPLLPHLTYLNLSYAPNGAYQLSKLVSSVPNLQYLDLNGNYAKGVIPEQIGTLQNLLYLDLSYNELEGVIPEQIGTLQNLLYLNLVGNSFYNPVPWQSLANLSRLTYLSLGSKYGGGPVLIWESSQVASQWQCNWKALESLSCHGMRFASNISIPFCLDDPRVVAKLKDLSFQSHVESIGPLLHSLSLTNASLRLKTLSFRETSLLEFEAQNPKSSWLHALDTPFLEVLDVSSAGLTGIPFWLPHLPHLHRLDMSFNSLSEFPRNLLNSSLESLIFYSNAITGAIPLFLLKPSLLYLDVSYNLLSAFSAQGNLSSLAYLDLSHNVLAGVVPLSLGRLSNLSYLYLSSNKLIGEIPLSIGEWSNLVHLDLSSNSLTGAIPLSVGNMSNLLHLDLSSNSLTGAIPLSVANMSSLVDMNLGNNKLSGTIPVSLGNLSFLQSLVLSANDVTGTIPTSVFQNSLAILDLSKNKLVGSLPHNLQNCASLGQVYVSNNNLSGSSLVLQNCELLYTVDLANNRFTGDVSHTFHNCKELMFLDMSNNLHIWGEIPREIGNCSNLATLVLSNNYLSGNIPRELFNPRYLAYLDLSSNNLTGALPAEIGNCSGLYSLNIGNNSLSLGIPVSLGKLQDAHVFVFGSNNFDGGIPAALQNCSSLVVLDLSDNQLSGTIPEWIRGENLPYLQLLKLRGNRLQGSLQVLESLLLNLTSLRVLDLASNYLSGTMPRNLNHLQGMTNKGVPGNRMTKGWDVAYISTTDITIKGSDRLFYYDILGNIVTVLDFSNNLLEGEIPLEIGALNGLLSLNLSRNAFNGSIPSSLGELAGVLESLDLSNNKLTGPIPSKLCLFSSLGFLDLSHNRLKGAITLSSSCTQLCTFSASSYAGNDQLLYECSAPPKSHDTPATHLPASPPPLHLTLVAKLQEHISLEGMGLGHVVAFLLMGLLIPQLQPRIPGGSVCNLKATYYH